MLEEKSSENMCCCEYINYKGEKSHLIATLCDCEIIDNIVERCISHKPISPDHYTEACNVLQDRIRIPWYTGGARRIDLQILIPLFVIPLVLCIAAQGLICTSIIFILLSCGLFVFYVWCLKRQLKTNFYVYWLIVSLGILLGIFQTLVVPFLEIRWSENLLLMLIITGLFFSLSYVRINALSPKNDGRDILPISRNKWFFKRDNYSLWINCSIGPQNYIWFIIGLLLLTGCSFYIADLIYTTLCQPISAAWDLLLIPYDCSDVYSSFYTGISFVSAIYASVIGTISSASILWEILNVIYTLAVKK